MPDTNQRQYPPCRPRAGRPAAIYGRLVLLATLALTVACGDAIDPTSTRSLLVTFDGLPPQPGDGTVSRGCTYSEDGVTIDNLNCGGGGAFGSIHSSNYRYSASVSFYNNVPLGVTQLTLTGGGRFDLVSIDLDGLNGSATVVPPGGIQAYPQPAVFTFIGTRPDATTVTESFTTDHNFPDRQTFRFSALFDRVTRVTWMQDNGHPRPSQQFDNIVLVPNP